MTRIAFVVAVLASILVGTAGAGDSATPSTRRTTSVAMIDMARVFKSYGAFHERREELKREVEKTAKQIQTMAAMGGDLKKGLDAAKTPEERQRFERDLLKLNSEIENVKTLAKSRIVRQEAVVYREIYDEIQQIVIAYAREEGFTMVLRNTKTEVSANDEPKKILEKLNQLVVFAEDHHDITDAIIERLNAEEVADTDGQ